MKKPFVYIVLALIFTLFLVLYKHLGGFNEPAITFEPAKDYVFSGKSYMGEVTDPAVELLFSEMRKLKLEGRYNGPLVMIWFEEPETGDSPVSMFIGIEVLPNESMPENLDSIRIEMNGLVRASIKGHASVMPNPSSIVEQIRTFAGENNYELQDIVIDKYLSDSIIYTEIPITTTH